MTADAPDASAVAVRIRSLTKRYGGTLAVNDLTLDVAGGEIHAIVGENGAGKSTVVGILSGRAVPTSGEVLVFGERLPFGSPRAAHRLGIAAIYQELTMVPALSAVANVFLGQELGRGPALAKADMRRRFVGLCEQFGEAIDPNAAARDLPIAKQQVIEILRGVIADARLMLFDEPTAALPEHGRETALAHMRKLRAKGTTVILVSHHLDEVLAVSDRISVMRNGRLVASRVASEWSKAALVRAMVGRDVVMATQRPRKARDDVLLRADRVTVGRRLRDVSLTVHAGEIVGLAGLVGAGRTTLLRAIAGLEPTAKGRLWIDDREVPWPRDVPTAINHGVAMVPEDRKGQGLVLGMSVVDNITLPNLRSVSRLGIVVRKRQRDAAGTALASFDVPAHAAMLPVKDLSGGNQQRVLIAKWLFRTPRVLLADEPTRGIDVAAKAEVLNRLQDLADQGIGIVMASSELEEVLAVSDRVLVLADGELVEGLDNPDGQLSGSDVLRHAFRVAGP